MTERREAVRVQAGILLEFEAAAGGVARSVTRNISETGMCFPTPETLRVGQVVPIAITLGLTGGALSVPCEVCWAREISRIGGVQYEVGVRFRWEGPAQQEALVEHLVRLLRQET